MAEPTYEVTVKNDTPTPAPAAPPTLSEDQISALVETKAQQKAETIATSKVEALKEDLAKSLSGKKGRYDEENGPKSWDDLHERIATDAERRAEEKIEKKLAEIEKTNEEKSKQTLKQTEEAQKAEMTAITRGWESAVRNGVLPDIAPEIRTKLQAGNTYAQLSPDEQKDPGLRAYNEALQLHVQLKNQGKVDSFLETATYHYRKQPAGVRAPVIGGAVSAGQGDDELSYDEVKKNRIQKFGF